MADSPLLAILPRKGVVILGNGLLQPKTAHPRAVLAQNARESRTTLANTVQAWYGWQAHSHVKNPEGAHPAIVLSGARTVPVRSASLRRKSADYSCEKGLA